MSAFAGYQQTQALRAAIELDLFTAIADGAHTSDALAKQCQASNRGMRILCDYLCVNGFLTKEGGQYNLAPDADAFLNQRSPAYLGSVSGFLTSDHLTSRFANLTETVRRGSPADRGSLEPEHPMWVEFARSMTPMMRIPADMLARALNASAGEPWRVLDIAAGHGLFGLTIAQQNPNAHITALDWPNVLELAKENARNMGMSERYSVIPGSAFEVDFGDPYDVILLTNFLHHFDHETNVKLLRKVHGALNPGGRAATLEFVPNEDRISPPWPASFSLMMLGSTPGGDAYTFPEIERMFSEAGFAATTRMDLKPTPQTLLISTK